MIDTRQKNSRWGLNPSLGGGFATDQAQLAVLMDIRDELQSLNRRMDCAETLSIPRVLEKIRKNTTPKRRKRCLRLKPKRRGRG